MTSDDQVLQRAPKGWEKPRHADYTWRPSNASNFDVEQPWMFQPEIKVLPNSFGVEDLIHDYENDFDDGATVRIKADNAYFLPNDDSSEVMDGEWKTVDFLDLEDHYEIIIDYRNMAFEEALKKAKELMKRIKSKDDLAEIVKEKKNVFYGIETDDVRKVNIEPYLIGLDDEDEFQRDFGKLLYLSNDKQSVQDLTYKYQSEKLREEADKYKENIEKDIDDKREVLKSMNQNLINFE